VKTKEYHVFNSNKPRDYDNTDSLNSVLYYIFHTFFLMTFFYLTFFLSIFEKKILGFLIFAVFP
jgi:hypothetical protein